MKYKYMIISIDSDSSLERTVSNMTANGWQLKSVTPIFSQGQNRALIQQGERLIFEKSDSDGMTDSELEALSAVVRVQLANHEVQASMAAQHGDFISFYSPQYELLMQELRRRGVLE